MGWWSSDPLGGDTPLDILGNLEDKLGLRDLFREGQFDGLYPLDGIYPAHRPVIARVLHVRMDTMAPGDFLDLIWKVDSEDDEDRMIRGQVLGCVVMAVGADMPAAYREEFRYCAQHDFWAHEDEERLDQMKKLYDALGSYEPGTPVVMEHTGLFQKINEAGIVREATELLGGNPGSTLVNTGPSEQLDAETIYLALRATAEQFGFVDDHADSLLGDAASAIADDPRSAE